MFFALLLIFAWMLPGSATMLPHSGTFVVAPVELARAPYPRWAHGHWVWLSARAQSQQGDLDLVRGYKQRNISVAALNVDSTWTSFINSFVFDNATYPNPQQFLTELHGEGLHVIAWATSLVNVDTPLYIEARDAGFLLSNGSTVKWWHGVGAFVDYFNPAAVAWWHRRMDAALDLGIDGFKTDGSDPYVLELEPCIRSSVAGCVGFRDYANAYYGDFYDYPRSRSGNNSLIMARPVDHLWHFAPKRVMVSGWVGDQDPTFDGLTTAMWNIIESAEAGYANFGSDIGGYRLGHDPPLGRTGELLTRWAQAMAFMPLMENGGENVHTPWSFGKDVLDIYRRFVEAHVSLGPTFLATGTKALATGTSSITPLGYNVGYVWPTSYDFLLGLPGVIFVSPILEPMDSTNVSHKDVSFPAGASWVDFFNESGTVHVGGHTEKLPFTLADFPVYSKVGSLQAREARVDGTDYELRAVRVCHESVGDADDPADIVATTREDSTGAGHSIRATLSPLVSAGASSTRRLRISAHPTATISVYFAGPERPRLVHSLPTGLSLYPDHEGQGLVGIMSLGRGVDMTIECPSR